MAFEIEEKEARKARERARTFLGIEPDIRCQEFLGWALNNFGFGEKFDAVLGNPPYIRYQYLDEGLQEIAEAIFKCHFLPFTRHTNAWVPFVVASLSLLEPGGGWQWYSLLSCSTFFMHSHCGTFSQRMRENSCHRSE